MVRPVSSLLWSLFCVMDYIHPGLSCSGESQTSVQQGWVVASCDCLR